MDKPIYVRLDPNETTLERRPVVTYTLMVVWILGALLISVWPAPDLNPLYRSLKYLEDPGYTPVHPDFEKTAEMFLGKSRVSELPIETVYLPNTDQLIPLQREQLDGLAALKGQPSMRFGLVAGHATLSGFLLNGFFHVSALILLINLMFIKMAGALLEDRWGRLFHVAFIIGAGLFSSLLALLFHRAQLPFYGGSGITAAFLGAYTVRFWGTGLQFKTFFWSYGSGFVVVPTFVGFLVLLVTPFGATLINQFLGSPPSHPGPGVILFLYLFGVGAAFAIKYLKLEPVFSGSDFDALAKDEQIHTKVDRALFLGRTKDAFEYLQQGVKEHPNDLNLLGRYWDQAVRTGNAHQALEEGLVLMEADREDGAFEEAFFVWKEWVRHIEPHAPLNASMHWQLLHDLSLAGLDREADEMLKAFTKRNAPLLDLERFHQFIAEIVPINGQIACQAVETRLESVKAEKDRRPLLAIAAQLRKTSGTAVEDDGTPEAIEISPLNPTFNPDLPPVDENPFRPTLIENLKVLALAHLRLDGQDLRLMTQGKAQEKRLPLTAVKAIFTTKIAPLGDDPSVILDLFLDDPMQEAKQHRCLRFRITPYGEETLEQAILPLYKASHDSWPQFRKMPHASTLPDFNSEAEFAMETYGTVS
jgi:membrane associated rhomboid family serine protease